MHDYEMTLIKAGNSYALRVPKRYVEDGKLRLGQKVSMPLPAKPVKQDRQRIQMILAELQSARLYEDIADAGDWQRATRANRPQPGRD